MSDEKKLPRSKKELLRQLGVISPLDEIREQMAALTNPLYMAGMRDQIAALTNPSLLAGMREEMAALTNPLYMAGMRDQIAALTNPSSLTQMREEIAALTNPSHLAGMREEMAALTNPSHLAGMREEMAALTNPSYLTQMREQMAAIGNGGRMQAELSAVIGSYQELISGSTLASFLVSPRDAGKPPSQVVEAEGSDRLEVGDFAILYVDQAHIVDLEIVKAISEGGAAALSIPAVQRLQLVYLQIVAIWDMLLRIFNTSVAVGVLVALMSGASKPADVPKQAALLPDYERQFLADYRIVNRDGARLRAGPSTDSAVLVSLQLGMPVEVLEKNDKGWFFVTVEYQGEWIEGWIYLSVTTPVPAPQRSRGLLVDADTSLNTQ